MLNYYIADMEPVWYCMSNILQFKKKRKCDFPTDDIQNEETSLDTDTRNV